MTMIDILMSRLPDGLTIIQAKEKPSKYVVSFAYNGEPCGVPGELMKACAPGKENSACDITIQTVMTAFMLEKGDIEASKYWMNYAKRKAEESKETKTKTILFVTGMVEFPNNCLDCEVAECCKLPWRNNTVGRVDIKMAFTKKRHEDCPLREGNDVSKTAP